MALPLEQQTPVLQQPELLLEIEAQGTPLRIDGQAETYYVLSASQLRLLMEPMLEDGAGVDTGGDTAVDVATGFTLEDFGLTEADVAEYEQMLQEQRKGVAFAELKPLPANLAERLSEDARLSHDEIDAADREALLRKLEAAMVANLRALATTSITNEN